MCDYCRLPYAWSPTVVDTQLLSVGQVAVVAVPGEFTTMAGRRLRETVQEVMGEDVKVGVGGTRNYLTFQFMC